LRASTGNGSTNSRRRRISDNSVGDAPALSSRFSSATTSRYVKPPVSKDRRTFANADAGEDVLAAINVVNLDDLVSRASLPQVFEAHFDAVRAQPGIRYYREKSLIRQMSCPAEGSKLSLGVAQVRR
jgi:hypothetical protein